jgi:hypothetical protein
MPNSCALEIHFHDQDRASIFLEDTGGPNKLFVEILLFASYAIRQVANLGNGAESRVLGQALVGAGTNLETLIGYRSSTGPSLVPYQGAPGRKRFTARLDVSDDKFNFVMSPHGFGLLGRGLGFYSPMSVLLLLQYLVERNLLDEEYLSSLGMVTAMTGQAVMDDRIRLANQNDLALRAAMTATNQKRRLRSSWQTSETTDRAADEVGSETETGASEFKQRDRATAARMVMNGGLLSTDDWVKQLGTLRQHADIQSDGLKVTLHSLVEQGSRYLRTILAGARAEQCPAFAQDVAEAVTDGLVIGRRLLGSDATRQLRSSPEDALGEAEALIALVNMLPPDLSAEPEFGLRQYIVDWSARAASRGLYQHVPTRADAVSHLIGCFDVGVRLAIAEYQLVSAKSLKSG